MVPSVVRLVLHANSPTHSLAHAVNQTRRQSRVLLLSLNVGEMVRQGTLIIHLSLSDYGPFFFSACFTCPLSHPQFWPCPEPNGAFNPCSPPFRQFGGDGEKKNLNYSPLSFLFFIFYWRYF